jgi:hypothetical protein
MNLPLVEEVHARVAGGIGLLEHTKGAVRP